jgi:hypothetical protein
MRQTQLLTSKEICSFVEGLKETSNLTFKKAVGLPADGTDILHHPKKILQSQDFLSICVNISIFQMKKKINQ